MPADLSISVSSPLSEQSPTGVTIHGIGPEPSFPALTATAIIPGVDPATIPVDLLYYWQMQVSYSDTVREDTIYYPENDWETSVGPQWQPQFPMICGGDLSITCWVELPTGDQFQGATPGGDHRILGGNPERVVIRNSLPADNLVYTAVLWQESRFTQFKDGHGISNKYVSGYHYPIRGHDPGGTIGYGLGQLTSPEPEVHDLWDWTWNVASTMERLNSFRANAETYAAQVISGEPWDETTGGSPPNEGTAFPNASLFTEDELDLEMLARYNGGYRYHNWDPTAGQWVRRRAAGQDAGTSLPYADKVKNVASRAVNGDYPSGWD